VHPSSPPASPSGGPPSSPHPLGAYRWAAPGDVNAFFGLILDNVVNLAILAGILVCVGVLFNDRVTKIDDPCGAISVHGFCGFLGAVCVGIFADGSYGALFELNEHGRLALDTTSIDRRGGRLFIFVNGRPITELQVDRRVSDGKIYVPAGLTAKDIELLRKDWPQRK